MGDFKPTYGSINSLNTDESDYTTKELPDDDKPNTDDDEYNLLCEINLNAEHYRLCKDKAAHDAVMRKTDVSPAMKTLTATEASHLNPKGVIKKLDEIAETVDLDVSTTLEEQFKDPVPGIVWSWLRTATTSQAKSTEIQQSNGFFRYCQKFDRVFIEEEGQWLCYNEPSDKKEDANLWNCLLLSLFSACCGLGRNNEMGRYIGASRY